MYSERPLSFKRASFRQTLYPYPDSPALGEQQDRRSMSSTGGALPRRDTYRSGAWSLFPQKTGEQLIKTRDEEISSEERDPAQIEAAYLNLVGGGGHFPQHISSEFEFGTPAEMDGTTNGYALSPNETRKKTNYFEEQFQYKGHRYSKVRERIENDSPVVAELRTNVIVKDEFTLVTDMSYNLSQRYSRPESSIMINVDHSACVLLAGSFEPAYILTISALPSQLHSATNKRNAALIQSFMAEFLSVPPERGILRFQPIAEEHLATNGTTILGEIERIEKTSSKIDESEVGAGGVVVKRPWTKNTRRSVHAKKPTLKNVDEPPSVAKMTMTNPLQVQNHSRQPSKNRLSLTSHPGPGFLTSPIPPAQASPVQELPASPVTKEIMNDLDKRRSVIANDLDKRRSVTANDYDKRRSITANDYEKRRSAIMSSLEKRRSVIMNGLEKRRSVLNGILKNVTNSPRLAGPNNNTTATTTTTAAVAASPTVKNFRPPPIPVSSSQTPTPKSSKRMSFAAIFRR